MQFEERSYAGSSLRPKPVIMFDDGLGALVVLTAWGNRDEIDRIQRVFADQIRALENSELTTPFGRVESLSSKANQLRTACYLCHDLLYREVNRLEFSTAIEVLALHLEHDVLSWAQIGAPNLYLRQAHELHPLAVQLDLSWQFGQSVPLASSAMGLDTAITPQCGSLHLPSGSDLVLLSRSAMPAKLYANCPSTLNEFATAVAGANTEAPFWAGWITT